MLLVSFLLAARLRSNYSNNGQRAQKHPWRRCRLIMPGCGKEAKRSAADIRGGVLRSGTPEERRSSVDCLCSQVPMWAFESVHLHTGPSGTTAVLLGSHQHFAVLLLLLFFKGIFYLPSLQSSIPAKEWSMIRMEKMTQGTFYSWLVQLFLIYSFFSTHADVQSEGKSGRNSCEGGLSYHRRSTSPPCLAMAAFTRFANCTASSPSC